MCICFCLKSPLSTTVLFLVVVPKEKPTEYKLYVSGINEETKASDLQDLFTKQCKILDAKIIRFSKIPNQCFGLVTFDSASLVKKCMDSLNKTSLKGNTIVLSQVSFNLWFPFRCTFLTCIFFSYFALLSCGAEFAT